MKDVFKKVLLSICIYLILMIIVSGCSNLHNNQNLFFSSNGDILIQKVKKQTEDITQEIKEAQTAEVTAASPFGFTLKIIEEKKEEQSLLHFYCSIGYLTSYNYIEEIEKRKTKLWYKRKFVLCFIKNRIKILKLKKWKLNIVKNKLS